MIAFTGNLATGQKIASIGAPMMKKLHLEFRGEISPSLPRIRTVIAAKAVAYAALINTGQVCTARSGSTSQEGERRNLPEAIVEQVKSLRLGSGLESTTDMGPMIGETYRAKFEKHIADAKSHGAKILTGGGRPKNLAKGFFHEPTVLSRRGSFNGHHARGDVWSSRANHGIHDLR